MNQQTSTKPARHALSAALISAALVVSACGGGDDVATSPGNPATGSGAAGSGPGNPGNSMPTAIPATALASSDQFIAWMKSWIGNRDDRSTAVRYEKASVPIDDRGRPQAVR